jgi:RNA recognition motif-containing protein
LQYGDIESADILKDMNSGLSRGFGFVTFKDEAVA